ncbi:MAG TPA: nucleoid-associated protein [Cytophagaceae bacterium]|nr:nucleoid-associated protein [Cytophagaceae bacterium]
MFNFHDSTLNSLAINFVGNKSREEQLKVSKSLIEVDQPIRNLLVKYFLGPFKNNEFYNFTHNSDLDLNEIYTYASEIFSDPDRFFIQSVNVSKHLYENSVHPRVKGGELYIAYFSGCIVEGEVVDAIGIFKSESRETYLKVYPAGDGFEVSSDDGININKLDKGCLIFNSDKETGYKVCIADNINRSDEARYWRDDFLGLKPRHDSYHMTQNYLQMCKSFITEKVTEDFEVSKADEIDLMNKSVKYFKEKEVFDLDEFTTDIIRQPALIDSFRSFKDEFQKGSEMRIYDEFNISATAVKSSSRIFKSVIKLDKSFHIYVHGNRNNIVKGFDEERQMNYYQIFFKEEN